MTITADWVIYGDERSEGRDMTIDDAGAIDYLLDALAEPGASDAQLTHSARPTILFEGENFDDHAMTVGLHSGFGYIYYDDEAHPFSISAGAAGSPSYPAYHFEFAAGSGISIDALREALNEFLTTAKRPTNIEWRALDPTPGDDG